MIPPLLIFSLILIIYTNRDVWGYVVSYSFSVSILNLNQVSKLSGYTNKVGDVTERIENLSGQEDIFTGSTRICVNQ